MEKEKEGEQSYSFYAYKLYDENKFKRKFEKMKVHVKKENRNLIYRHMRTQKILMQVFQKFETKDPVTYESKKKIYSEMSQGYSSIPQTINLQKTMSPISHLRQKTQPTPRKKRSITPNQTKQEMKLNFQAFNKTLGKFHEQVKKKEKVLKVLNRYNNMTNQYLETMPKDLGEKTRQSVQEDNQIFKICVEQITTQDVNKKYHLQANKLHKYREPSIPPQISSNLYRQIRENTNKRKTIRNQLRKNEKGVLSAFK